MGGQGYQGAGGRGSEREAGIVQSGGDASKQQDVGFQEIIELLFWVSIYQVCDTKFQPLQFLRAFK